MAKAITTKARSEDWKIETTVSPRFFDNYPARYTNAILYNLTPKSQAFQV